MPGKRSVRLKFFVLLGKAIVDLGPNYRTYGDYCTPGKIHRRPWKCYRTSGKTYRTSKKSYRSFLKVIVRL